MTRVIALTVVLGLTGVPVVGGMLCGAACAPAAAQPVGCHDHAADGGPVATLSHAHTCDHAATAAPAVLQPTPAGASVQVAGFVPTQPNAPVAVDASEPISELPPGTRPVVIPLRTSVLRI